MISTDGREIALHYALGGYIERFERPTITAMLTFPLANAHQSFSKCSRLGRVGDSIPPTRSLLSDARVPCVPIFCPQLAGAQALAELFEVISDREAVDIFDVLVA